MSEPITTKITRDRDGKLRALTIIELDQATRRELRIETSKNGIRGGVETDASVVQVSKDGLSFTHAFGFKGCGDYRKVLASDRAARATQKNIEAMHASALTGLDAVIAEARAHYAGRAS